MDADFATTATALTAARSMEITGAGFTNGAVTIDSLRINGATALNMTGLLTIRTAGTTNASGGIIQTGGSGSISGTGVSTGGSGALVINVDGGANTLQLDAPITSTTTGGFTKVGAGTLRLGAANAQTGTISINEGTVRLTTGGRLGAASAALAIRQDGILELNGITPATATGAFNNNGIVRNTSATTDVTFTVGGGNGTGVSNGIIENGGPNLVNVVKVGTGGQSWLGLSTYTGTTTIGSTGIVIINNLAIGGMASGIGASSSAAGNLIFDGASTTQAYGGLNFTGTTNDETDRLFTFNGGANGGARIQSNGINFATSSWTNTGTLAFGVNATGNAQGLVLGGGSTGDNRFSPIITDNGAAKTSLYKSDAGVWYLGATNTYSGVTQLNAGTLYAQDGTNIKKDATTGSNIVFNGGNFAATGAFNRTIGTAGDQMQWGATASGGFSAGGSSLTVDWGTGNVWGTTAGFLGTGALLLNNSGVAKSDVDVISGFEITQGAASAFNATTTAASATVTLTSGTTAGWAIGQEITGNANIPTGYTIATITGPTTFTLNSATGVLAGTSVATSTLAGGYRQVNVGDFTSIGADFATISGIITGAGNLAKEGVGILALRGANTYTGQTLVRQGTLVVTSLGLSSVPGSTSVGDSTLGNTDAGALILGNGGTTAGILEYVGLGETSDRKIRLNTTTGSSQIHADGVGPLILTNVANDMVAGAKILYLRGVNSGGNMITSQLSNNGGNLSITVDGSATWILTNSANDYSGNTSVNGGALGIGHNNALGDGTGTLSISNGSVFAYGGDRTISNPITQSSSSGTIAGFTGDYSLTLTGLWTDPSTTSTTRFIRNNIVSGKTLTLAGDYIANAGTTSLGIGFDGSGATIVTGNISSTMPSFGVIYAGTGSLTLSGANTYTGKTRITSGTLILGANEVLPNAAITPENNEVIFDPGLGLTATLDLNGKNETINGLTMNSAGTAIIDNTSATAASLTFGANNSAVSIGGGVGAYTITDSGAGALSITKTGNANITIPTGVTLTYQGATTVNGGSMTIASAVDGTTALNVRNPGSTLALTGGITSPSAITSVVVENGGTLSLLDGAGSQLSQLTNLQLGSTGGTLTTLALNVGDIANPDMLATDTLTLLSGGTLSLFAGNQIKFDLTDAGLNGFSTYHLIDVTDGGLTLGALGLGDWILGTAPGGFTSITLNKTDTLISITTGALITGTSYWRGVLGGGTDTTWNGNANNWTTSKTGLVPAVSTPGSGTDVVFQWDAPNNAAVVTTLEQNFKINSLTFEDATVVANTATSITINPGANTTSRLEIAPQLATDGIKLRTTNATAATISGAVKLGGVASSQTWEVTNAGSVLSLGSLFGERDVIKTGLGKVTLTAAADPTFNSGATADFTINAGTLEITDVSALGNPVNANLATVTVNSTGVFYYNGLASTATNLATPLTLHGGTLSAGSANQIYSGPVNVNADSFLNMADFNGPGSNTARSITLSGVMSGSGGLTVSSNTAVLAAGNAEGGTLTISNNANTWNGPVVMKSGTIVTTASNGLGGGSITFDEMGRIIVRSTNGIVYDLAGTMNFSAGAIGEFSVDNTSAVLGADFVINQNGQVNIGSGAAVRLNLADAASSLNLVGDVVLGGNGSISVEGGDADSFVTISGVISDGGSGYALAVNDDLYGTAGVWATNTILRVTGANTFTGNVTLASGTLQFTTVTDISGGASSLGNGTAITFTGSSILNFVGSSAQATNRTLTSTAGVITLAANGVTAADTITYNGAITVGPVTDGSQIVLTGAAGREGIISGGILQTGDLADMTVNGGTWTHQTGTSRIGDTLTVTGADTVLNLNSGLFQVRNDFTVTLGATLNLGGTGVLSYDVATLSADATLRATTGGIITLLANDAVVPTQFDGLRIGVDAAGIGTLNMGTFNQTVTEFILGNRNLDRSGIVNGTGTLTVTGNLDVYAGTIYANLASTGSTFFEKIGADTVTLFGNNSGLASTGATVVYDGILALNYTVDNNTKLRAASALDMRGARLNVIGNNGAATVQNVGGLTLVSGGSSTIQVLGGTGQTAVLNLGAITRGNLAQDGTIRFILPSGAQSASNGITTTSPNSTFGMLGTGATATSDAAYATVEDGTGTWFATSSGGNIVALVSTAKNDVTSWLAGDHVTDDTTGYTGTLQHAFLNSLRFDAAGGSDIGMSSTGVLIIGSGGFLITSNVGGTPSMMNGTLASGAAELVITQDSSQPFEIGSDIRINHGVTKTGTGILTLSGNNVYTGVTEIQEGVLRVTGNSIGDTSVVALSASRATTLELLASETIGRLSGGQRATDGDYGTVAVGSHTLTINNSGANTTFAGFFTGDGNIIKQGTHNLGLTNLSTGFTGILTVESGMVQMLGLGQINANIIRINKGGALIFDNNGTTTPSVARILDTTAITLNSADGTFNGQTIVRGLAIRNDNDATRDETIGTLNLNTGANYVSMEATTSSDDADIIATDIQRFNNATLNVRGTNLGGASAQENELRIGDATNQSAFIATLVGGGGAAGSQNISIVPWAIGESTPGVLAATHMGNSLVTYVSGSGFRPLDFATEYDTIALAAPTDNARESLTANLTGLLGTIVNALVLNNNSVTAATHAVTGTGAGQTLAVTSGAMLFTLNPAAAAGDYGITLGGFDSGITVGATNEYIIHVVNPDAGTPTKALTATISSSLTSAADITKSGRGTLILSGLNTAGGGGNKTTINEGILEIADLDNIGGDTGSLVFAGGTLRLGTGLTDDISLRAITLLDAGGTIDTNGIDLVLANSVGSGRGGLTKIGLGNLTLNATATYTGATTITTGTVSIGANNATGNGGDLSVGGGAALALGSNGITAGLVTLSGASPAITGTGTVNASTGFLFSNTGNITVDAILAGSGGLFKNQTNTLTLSGLNTYTGTTEIQSGVLSINSITNVGGGASALGNSATAEDGIIRMGLTTTATTLNYTGSGHTSDRLVGMQGTTGGVTLDADGTGAFGLGGARFEMAGNKILTLRGSSATSLVNTIGALTEIGGVLTLNKADANTWMVNEVSSYTGVTQIDNGTLMIGVDDALPLGTTVRLGSGTTAGTFDLNGFNQTITSFLSQTNSALLTNSLIVDTAKTLTVNGAVTIGANAASSTTLLSATGGGAFVNNNSGGIFQVGGATGSTNSNVARADFSGLSSFTVDLGATGLFRVGDDSSNTGTVGASTLILATDNIITAGTLQIASTQTNALQTLQLGSGTNLLNVNTLQVSGATRGIGTLNFASGTGSVHLRAVDGTSASVVNIAQSTTGTANALTGMIDLAGHDADLLISTLTMADRTQGTGSTTATLTFDEGTLEVGTLNMASRTSTGTGNATATVNLGDSAAVGTPTVTIGAINMAVNTSAGGVVNADLNVTGGNVSIGDGLNSGIAINMANAGTGRTVTSTITLTGGSVDVTGDISRTGGAGTENASVILNGATLNMHGNEIGSGASQIVLSAQSGRLENLGELNSGAGLTKTTAGTLILEGTNTYTGTTTISAGTLQIGSGGSTGTIGAGSIVNNGTLAVNRDNSYTLSNTISGSGAFEQNGTGTTILTGTNSYTGTTDVNTGALYINGDQSTATGAVTVAVGATLASDNGQIGGDTTIQGTLDAGAAPLGVGVIHFTGATTDLTLAAGSTWLIDIVQGGIDMSDTVNVGGALTIGAMDPTFRFSGTYTVGTKYTIATYGSLSGAFSSYADNTVYTLGGSGEYLFNYNDGGAITLTAVPEPGTLGFLGVALGGFFVRRLRRRRKIVAG